MKTDETPTNPARILVVDDHSIVRHGIAMLLAREKDLQVCGEASSYEEGLAALDKLKPDLAVIDITLKDRSGLDLIREAKAKGSATQMLALSMHDEETHAEKALRAGARGYVMKEKADEVILDAIRKVLKGDLYVSETIASRMMTSYLGGETPSEANGIPSLTERELEIFECMGRGMSSREIADKLGLSHRTVEVHRAHIKGKLNCESAAQLLREAVRWVEQKP